MHNVVIVTTDKQNFPRDLTPLTVPTEPIPGNDSGNGENVHL